MADAAADESRSLAAVYDPRTVEAAMYERWLEADAFAVPANPAGRPRFSIVMPPPNVTGRLHIGHALDNALQDVFVRWHRMCGDATVWVPGTDHAGIATQAVVERRLASEGLARREMGRDAFVAAVWRWKGEYEAGIVEQLRRLGCSCDWTRQRFTLDPGLSDAVEEVFLRYWRDGLLYRGDYIVNWCPSCGTAISDLEVDHRPEESHLYRIRYAVEGGGHVVIATVRPETMLGDTAVAVHPEDARYRSLVGRLVVVPLTGRRVPVVADAHVDPAFGTGALKVTPAHDADDAAIAGRHGLAAIGVIGTDGRMTVEAGAFAGLTVDAARTAVVAALRTEGLLEGSEPYEAAIGRCSRCDGVVEPLISRQWFVRMEQLAAAAARAVRDERIRFVPEGFARLFLQWMDGVHDWCISRQLWWGHRIPAYECPHCGEVVVARQAPDACPRCGAGGLERDPDVLDTWFSSALWPLSTLGWPDGGADFASYFPTDLLVTGRDILFFWVARMAFSSLHLTGEVPFRVVLLHGLVRDAQGRKMSKSRGIGIDPMEMIDRYGADALRLTLLVGVAPGNDQRFAPEKLEGSRRFCNKLWNAARFALGALGSEVPTTPPPHLELVDRWMLGRLEEAAAAAQQALERLDAGEALSGLQSLVWETFCDWYLEAAKPRLYGDAAADGAASARHTLHTALTGILRLLHPFLPFITEAIWSQLPAAPWPLLATAPWPAPGAFTTDPDAGSDFELVRAIVGAVRSLRAEVRVPPAARVNVVVRGPGVAAALRGAAEVVRALARVDRLEERVPRADERGVAAVVGAGVEVLVVLDGVVDLRAEAQRLARERAGVAAHRGKAEARLADADFLARAKPEVIERERVRLETLAASIASLDQRIAQLRGPSRGEPQTDADGK